MSDWFNGFLIDDAFPLLLAVLSALACGLLGNYLVLRRQSLMGDAISHAVLPGLVGAFLITQTRAPHVMFIGAAVSALLTVALTELIKRLGRVEPGAAMGVVFSVLFALGVYMLESGSASNIDLDADCVLHGNLQFFAWIGAPDTWEALFSSGTLQDIPRQVWSLLITNVAVVIFVVLFFKELRITSFDPGIASVQGIHAGVMNMALMSFVAIAAVASFEAVGSILVIAMLICPAATARLLTDRLGSQVIVSGVVALLSAVLGYWIASVMNVNAAGMISVASGVLLVLAIVGSPSHGAIAKRLHRSSIARTIAFEDILGTIYRRNEEDAPVSLSDLLIRSERPKLTKRMLQHTIRSGLVLQSGSQYELSDEGELQAAQIIRRHRLWEGYLVDQAGLSPDHVHETAEQLEHLDLSARLPDLGQTDPQGKPIPPGG